MMSRPEAAMGQQHDWMGVGLSKPEQIFIMFEGLAATALHGDIVFFVVFLHFRLGHGFSCGVHGIEAFFKRTFFFGFRRSHTRIFAIRVVFLFLAFLFLL